MSATLISLAAQVGAPFVKEVLERRLGAENGELVERVVSAIARRVGIMPDALPDYAESHPEEVAGAIGEVERMRPELIALYEKGLEGQYALMQAEQDEPLWVRAWRPLGMYGLGALWFWNLVILHVANAFWKIALPMTDLSVLMQLSALYMGLYMGGHTVKDVAAKWRAPT